MTRKEKTLMEDEDVKQKRRVAAYKDGQKAYRDYVRYAENPYRDSDLADNWCNGWLEAEAKAHG